MPKVSIIVNCFNGEAFLREALDSIKNQTFTDWEVIFFDNKSTDDSAEIAKSYDDRFKYFCSDINVPLGEARKLALSHATGEWIAFLDVDDLWEPWNLQTQLDFLEGTDYKLSYGGISEIDLDGNKIREQLPIHHSGYIFGELLNQFDINMVTPIVNRQFILDNGLNFEPIITASEEYNLFMRIAAKAKVATHKKILGSYRVAENSLTNKAIDKWAFEREYTLNQLMLENEGIQGKYKVAFEEAKARGIYYKARYLMHIGDKPRARDAMKSISKKARKYYVLYILSNSSTIWNFFHSTKVKRKITKIFSLG